MAKVYITQWYEEIAGVFATREAAERSRLPEAEHWWDATASKHNFWKPKGRDAAIAEYLRSSVSEYEVEE